jgi:hypothetical protein
MGLKPSYGNGPHPLLWAGSRVARGKITVSGIPRPNYCEIFIGCTLFPNTAAGRELETLSVSSFVDQNDRQISPQCSGKVACLVKNCLPYD